MRRKGAVVASAQQSEPFGVRIGPDGPVVTGESTEVPVNAAGRLQALITRLPDASHVMCSVADLDEVLQELDEVTDLDRSALKTQELRDERNRAEAMWHEQKKRADAAEAEASRLARAYEAQLELTTEVCSAAEQYATERDQLRAELGEELEWGIGHPEHDGTTWYQDGFTRDGAHHHAAQGGDGRFPAWRRLGNWHNATEETP